MKHLTTAIQQAIADLEKGDTLCEINAAHILRQALAAASAVLTEPAVVAKVSHKGAAKWDVEFTWPVGKFEEDGDHKLYTEQQVRAMLATGWHHRKPNCITCNDRGAVGNILTAEPCPDCTPPQVQADALDAGVQRDADRYRFGCEMKRLTGTLARLTAHTTTTFATASIATSSGWNLTKQSTQPALHRGVQREAVHENWRAIQLARSRRETCVPGQELERQWLLAPVCADKQS